MLPAARHGTVFLPEPRAVELFLEVRETGVPLSMRSLNHEEPDFFVQYSSVSTKVAF